MDNKVLQNVVIKNDDLKNLLTSWSDYVMQHKEMINKCIYKRQLHHVDKDSVVANQDNMREIDYYVSEEYLRLVKEKEALHVGFPEVCIGWALNPKGPGHSMRWTDAKHTAEMLDWQDQHVERYSKFNQEMMMCLGTRHNALCQLYPPNEGIIGWHNNANASAYNLIFTYSETGDGYWQHLNPKTDTIETIEDIPGWQCKASYFGSYGEDNPNTLIYHAAKTRNSHRLTVSYIFERTNKDYWLDAIEEIEFS